jgi:hypothetical protein
MHTNEIIGGTTLKRPPRRKIQVRTRVPARSPGDPTDDELLRYLDGAMPLEEQAAFVARLEKNPTARARLEVLAEALEENGWSVDLKPGRGSS